MLKTRDEALDIAKRYKDFITKFLTVDFCYLYGSYATNQQHEWSDIDVAIVSPDFSYMPIDISGKILSKAAYEINALIEPIPIPPEELVDSEIGTIGYTILNKGIKI